MKIYFIALTLACVCFVGCFAPSEAVPPEDNSSDAILVEDLPTLNLPSGHPEHGPHGGELIELGKESFHIEMVHDAETVSMYVLDGAAIEPVAIDTEALTISLKQDGEIESFELSAERQIEDPVGKSSRFSSTNTKLVRWLEAESEGAVVLSIEGASYTGKISHDHDHSGHDHSGHDH